MRVHHLKHHDTYRIKVNEALQEMREVHFPGVKKGIDHLLTILPDIPEKWRAIIQNHGGGYGRPCIHAAWSCAG